MHRGEVSRLMAEGEALQRAGLHAEAGKLAMNLVRSICAARSMRSDKSTGVRKSDAAAVGSGTTRREGSRGSCRSFQGKVAYLTASHPLKPFCQGRWPYSP
jgi:hypothetical protein